MEQARERAAGGTPSVSVIVPVRERTGLLDRTLSSLARQATDAEFDIVIVDDGSTEDVRTVVNRHRGALAITYHRRDGTAPSPAQSRDLGAWSSSADVLVFLDSGVVASPDLVSAHATAHRQPGVIGVGYCHGHQIHRDQDNQWAELLADSDDLIDAWRSRPELRDMRYDLPPLDTLTQPWVYAWGGNLSCRSADYHAAGGFSSQHGYGFEDMDFSWRLYRKGGRPTLVRDGWSIHLPHPRAPLQARQASDTTGWRLSYQRDKAVELEIARLGIAAVGTGPGALNNLEAALAEISGLISPHPSHAARPLPPPCGEILRPAFAVAGMTEDLEYYDLVGTATPGHLATSRHWGCAGILLPVTEKIGTAVVKASLLNRLASAPTGGKILDHFFREMRGAARAVAIALDADMTGFRDLLPAANIKHLPPFLVYETDS